MERPTPNGHWPLPEWVPLPHPTSPPPFIRSSFHVFPLSADKNAAWVRLSLGANICFVTNWRPQRSYQQRLLIPTTTLNAGSIQRGWGSQGQGNRWTTKDNKRKLTKTKFKHVLLRSTQRRCVSLAAAATRPISFVLHPPSLSAAIHLHSEKMF